jgi:signal transduction histidine kinase
MDRHMGSGSGHESDRMTARRRTSRSRRIARARETPGGAPAYLRPHVVSVAAHELNTPLAGLRAYVQLMARRVDRRESLPFDQLHEDLQVIEYQAERLARTVALLIDSVSLRSGDLRLHFTVIDLVPLVEHRLALARAATGRQLFMRKTTPSLLARVDPQRIENLIGNLLENAIKYSPANASIMVELTAEADCARLVVTDSGIGIPAAQRESVFKPFYQVHRGAISDGMIGLGLGLFIARQIIELHGGTIALEAPSEGGTRVVVRLPIEAP